MNKKAYIGFLIVIAIAAGMFGYLNRPSSSAGPAGSSSVAPVEPTVAAWSQAKLATLYAQLIKMAAAPPLGNPKARWNAIEIGDFQCPNCGRAEPLIMDAIQSSGGKVKLYFVNFPLEQVHPHAVLAAEAGDAAAAQGKFWPMYHLLYSHQDELIDSEIEYNSRSIDGLDTTKLASDLSSHKYLPGIRQQYDALNAMGVTEVPTVIVRSPAGKFTYYVGTGGTKTVLGIVQLAGQSPWGGGIGVPRAKAILSSENQGAAAAG